MELKRRTNWADALNRTAKFTIFHRIINSLTRDEMKQADALLKEYLERSEGKKTEARDIMLQAIPLKNALQKWDFVPQAVIARPLTVFTQHINSRITSGHDALDEYAGIAYAINGMPFAVMHYKGHPSETSTIYFPRDVSAIEQITGLVSEIVQRFELPPEAVVWQRKDNPEL